MLRQIDSVGFDARAILNRFSHMIGKARHKTSTVFIDQYLCLVFGNDTADIYIKNLAPFKSLFSVLTRRQNRTINRRYFDFIGIIYLSKCGADTAGLTTRIAITFFGLFV